MAKVVKTKKTWQVVSNGVIFKRGFRSKAAAKKYLKEIENPFSRIWKKMG
jgi:hypothetical protein